MKVSNWNVSNWSAYIHNGSVIVESSMGSASVFPATDTKYTLSLGDGGYYLTTKPSYTTCFLSEPEGSHNPFQNTFELQAALNQYFISDDVEVFTTPVEKPKKYMRLPNSGTLVYLVDILSACRLTHGDHNGTSLFIQYPIGSIHISCGTIENAIADERALTEYLLSLR